MRGQQRLVSAHDLAGGDGLALDPQASSSVSSHGLSPVVNGLDSVGVTSYSSASALELGDASPA